tara:strand:- start:1561 stop:1896 length:336 start_codon:yes stop_codon:yes gene_type:complete
MVDGNQGSGKVLTSDANGVGTWQNAGGGGFGTWETRNRDTTYTAATDGLVYWVVEDGHNGIKFYRNGAIMAEIDTKTGRVFLIPVKQGQTWRAWDYPGNHQILTWIPLGGS